MFRLLIVFLTLLAQLSFAQAPMISSTTPIQNELNASLSTDISVTFDMDMDETSINDSTFVVNAWSTGPHLGAFVYDDISKTIIFDPYEDFNSGELVTVVLTSDIQSAVGTPLSESYVWSFTVIAGPGTAEFADQALYQVMDNPHSIYVADLDGDGDKDLAVANTASGNVSILLNNGAGDFVQNAAYPTGSWTHDVIGADLDGDGDIDLAIVNEFSDNASVLFNNGDGTFAPSINYSCGNGPVHLFGADYDGDGDIDLAIACKNDDIITVMINDGNGAFSSMYSYYCKGDPIDIFAADYDNDGDYDLAIGLQNSDSVSIYLNNGDASFVYKNRYLVANACYKISGADLDGDGDVDLAAASTDDGVIVVLLNDGNASFETRTVYNAGNVTTCVCTADFNGDGSIDIAATNYFSKDIYVYLNMGDGNFQLPSIIDFDEGAGSMYICAADLNEDTAIDIVITNIGPYSQDYITVFLNQSAQAMKSIYLDIKPGSCPNPLNVKPFRDYYDAEAIDNTGFASVVPEDLRKPNAKLPVAILGTKDFDVTDIDPSTIMLEGVPALRWSIEDVSTPVGEDAEECECISLGPDGFDDLTIKFNKGSIVAALGTVYDGDVIPLTISGQLYDGTEFEGVDCVVIKGTIEEYEGDYATISDTQNIVLIGNYPNPFNPETEISYSLPQGCDVRLEVFNIVGQKVVTLVDQYQDAGVHSVTWDSRGAEGKAVSSGIYLYRLTAGNYTETRKMILMK